jgi:hypothetical protein
MATFVLVHGAWHGGWCWKHVAALLRRAGHEVFAPTLTGLGERSRVRRGGLLQSFAGSRLRDHRERRMDRVRAEPVNGRRNRDTIVPGPRAVTIF